MFQKINLSLFIGWNVFLCVLILDIFRISFLRVCKWFAHLSIFRGLLGTMYSRMDQVNFFESCPPQIFLGPFLKTLSHLGPCQTSLMELHCNWLYSKQARDQGFFGAGEVSWNRGTSINVSWTTYKKSPFRRKCWCFVSKILLKLHFKWEFNP